MDIKIKSDKFSIVSTGSVIQFNNESITISLFDLSFVFNFISTGSKDPKVTYSASGKIFSIQMCDFNNSLGTGNTQPVELGQVDNKKLYLNYRVYALDDCDFGRTIYYTFYLEDEN